MLLNIYLGTTAISWTVVFIFSDACEKKIKRKGYKFVKEKESISEKIASFISNAFKGSIPVFNILYIIKILLMGDKFYKYMENELLKEGIIYMPTEKMPSDEDEFSPKEEAKTYTESKEKESSEKKYDEMILKEKIAYLEHEKEVLISQYMTIRAQTIEENSEDRLVKDEHESILQKTPKHQ